MYEAMSRADFQEASERIRVERSAKHIGVARINVEALNFPHSRSVNPKNVVRLKSLFQSQEGFKPDLENRIPAVITEDLLDEVLGAAGLSRAALLTPNLDYPRLDFPPGLRLECLRGQHRVKAAQEIFKSAPIYWVIDLFLAGSFLSIR